MTPPSNVLMIVADTARAGDAYASDPSIMPALARLATEGTRFDNAFATAPWTLPSHAALFTGQHSSRHGAHGEHPYLDEGHRTLATVFAENGYETWGASNNTWISGEFGFDRGFSTFWKGWQYIQSDDDVGSILHECGTVRRARAAVDSLTDGNPFVNAVNACFNHVSRSRGDYGAARTTARIESWLANRDGDCPFFAFVNYLEPHIQYAPPREYASSFLPVGATFEEAIAIRQEPRAYDVDAYDLTDHELALLRALYRGELAYVDAQVARIRAALEARGAWEDTLLVVLGDHGEHIGEHGFLGHQYNLYDTLLHVPLVINGGAFDQQGVRDDLVQLTDVPPTVLEATGLRDDAFSEQSQGRSLHPDRTKSREFVVAEYMAPQPPVETLLDRYGKLPPRAYDFDRRLRTIRTADEKLIRGSDGLLECYDLHRDPDERIDRADVAPTRVDALERRLDEWLQGFEHAEAGGEVTISSGTRQRLASLGYL